MPDTRTSVEVDQNVANANRVIPRAPTMWRLASIAGDVGRDFTARNLAPQVEANAGIDGHEPAANRKTPPAHLPHPLVHVWGNGRPQLQYTPPVARAFGEELARYGRRTGRPRHGPQNGTVSSPMFGSEYTVPLIGLS